jgi:flagellar hook-basal body complex protein FliE
MNSLTPVSASTVTGVGLGGAGAAASAGAAPFSSLLQNAIGEVSRLEESAEQTAGQLVAGTGVDVHQAVIAVEKANMAFELALAVRNKAVQAYQQVMNLQF